MEILKLLSGPIIGAIIGYCTNYIAVKMLFRPLKPVYLFGHQLPFTPGIIPKGQRRLARAIGRVVGSTLLTEEDMQSMLLSDELQSRLRENIDRTLQAQESTSLKQLCLTVTDETGYDIGRAVMQEKLTNVLAERVLDMDLGALVSQKVLEAVRQKVAGSLIGMMLSGDMLDSFAGPIQEHMNAYLIANIDALLAPQVAKAWSDAEETSIGEVNAALADMQTSLTDIVMKLYTALAAKKAADLLRMLQLGRVAEEKVMAMQPQELEELVMSVMKKELGAVVNLGALVGFIIGLLNLMF